MNKRQKKKKEKSKKIHKIIKVEELNKSIWYYSSWIPCMGDDEKYNKFIAESKIRKTGYYTILCSCGTSRNWHVDIENKCIYSGRT